MYSDEENVVSEFWGPLWVVMQFLTWHPHPSLMLVWYYWWDKFQTYSTFLW